MKLKSFRIHNYKSIIDSGECRLSDIDNVLILAGQNESGKSSILQALWDYERGTLREDAMRILDGDDNCPEVSCTYELSEGESPRGLIESELADVPSEIFRLFGKDKLITIVRKFAEEDKSELLFTEELNTRIKTGIVEHAIMDVSVDTSSDTKQTLNLPRFSGHIEKIELNSIRRYIYVEETSSV